MRPVKKSLRNGREKCLKTRKRKASRKLIYWILSLRFYFYTKQEAKTLRQSSFHQINIMMMNRFPFSGIINAKG